MNYMSAKKRGMVAKLSIGGRPPGTLSPSKTDTTGMSHVGLYPQEEEYSKKHPGKSQTLAQKFPNRGRVI